jgi:enamine deaminase RidA (YjgF/YER057c/UK114 family)
MTIQRFENGPRMSRVVVHGDTVYLAGLTADASVGKSVGEQTAEILGRIDALLKQGGTDKSKLLQAVIWLQDIRTVDEMNKVWDAWISPGNAPARACIEARLQSPAKMVEIMVTAAR